MLGSTAANSSGDTKQEIHKASFWLYLLFLPAFFLLILAMLVGMQYKQLKAVVSPVRRELPVLVKSPEAESLVLGKIREFFALAASGDTLALSAEELNHWIRTSASLEKLDYNYYLELQDTLLVASNSLPVASLRGGLALLVKAMGVNGYLNSEMRGYPSLKNGAVELVPVSASMNGRPAPASALSSKGNVNPREWVADTLFYDQALSRLSDVKVQGGTLLLIKRR